MVRVKLQNSVVGFVDILGYANVSKSAGDYSAKIETLISGIEQVNKETKSLKLGVSSMQMRVFSDNVCISLLVKKGAGLASLDLMVSILASYQWDLIREVGQFSRGGVAVGLHYVSKHLIFGPALVNAVEVEKAAGWPRIVLHNSFSEAWVAYRNEWLQSEEELIIPYNQFARGSDGLPYIDYLEGAVETETWSQEETLEIHKNRILQQVGDNLHNERILAKYRFLARYHNRKVSEWNASDTLMIDTVPLDGQSFRGS